jgi:hypothetical protein
MSTEKKAYHLAGYDLLKSQVTCFFHEWKSKTNRLLAEIDFTPQLGFYAPVLVLIEESGTFPDPAHKLDWE